MENVIKGRVSPRDESETVGEEPGHLRAVSTGIRRDALVGVLNEFLEGERAGARTARVFAAESNDARLKSLMRRVAQDEAWCCAMLTRHIGRLGGEVSRKTGHFFDKAIRRQGERDRLEYLNKGQTWVTRKLDELLPDVSDRLLHRDLNMMLRMHKRNVKRCAEFNP